MNMSWEADGARLTIFGLGPLQLNSIDTITGAPATQTGSRPAEQASFESGTFGKNGVIIARSPQRVDLSLMPGGSATNNMPAVITLGPADEAIRDLLTLGKKLIAKPADVQRLAFGLVLGQSAPSPADAVDIVLSKVPSFSKGTAQILDLFIQLNRPRASRIDPAIELNRLCKWQAVQVQLIQIPALASVPAAATNTFFRAVVDIDINTSQKTTVIPAARIMDLFDEFASLAKEIALKGDVP